MALPSSSTATDVPMGRGALPVTSTTVARAKGRASRHQRCSVSAMFSMGVSKQTVAVAEGERAAAAPTGARTRRRPGEIRQPYGGSAAGPVHGGGDVSPTRGGRFLGAGQKRSSSHHDTAHRDTGVAMTVHRTCVRLCITDGPVVHTSGAPGTRSTPPRETG